MLGKAAEQLALSTDRLRAARGRIIADDGRSFGYGQLVAENILHIQARPTSVLTPPDMFTQLGKSVPRLDIPAKVTGGAAYIQDMRLPGMVHDAIARPLAANNTPATTISRSGPICTLSRTTNSTSA